MQRKLLLVRHGQIRANQTGRWHGSTDSPLTWNGRSQARRVARALKAAAQESSTDITAIYSSPLQRCMKTAERIGQATGLPVLSEADLREYGVGELEDTPFKELAEKHDFFDRSRSDPTYAPPGGESIVEVSDRMLAVLGRIYSQHTGAESIVVVSHGAAMAIALASYLDGNPALWTNYSFDNCSLTELHLEPEPFIASYNRTDHL